jgi:5'-nucleotidase
VSGGPHERDERVLVTNDDGVGSPGLVALARAAASLNRRVLVAAPGDDQSGASAAIGPRPPEGVTVERVRIPGLDGFLAYAVHGPPAIAVVAARLGELGHHVGLVASGVNLGQNTGSSVLHSGTVGAALTGAHLGLSALAVSLAGDRPHHFDTATEVSAAALEWLHGAPPGTVLNVNIPDVPIDRIAGVREAPLARFGAVQAALREPTEGSFTTRLEFSWPDAEPGSDAALLAAGFVTVTRLVGVVAEAEPEVAGVMERALSRAA